MKVLEQSIPVDDGRSLDHQTLEQIRLRAVAAVQRGYSPEDVIDMMGLHRSCIYVWLDLFKKGGWEALRARPGAGRPPALDRAGKNWLQQTVLEGTPETWGYATALWTRGILAALVDRRWGVKVSPPTLGRYLHELKLSPQVPDWKAQEGDPEAVRRFLEEKFPRIVRLARNIGADLFFLDESGCRANEHRGRTWGLVGRRPVIQSTGQRVGLNMLSAVSPEGKLRFKVVDHSIRSQEVIDFLKAMRQGSERPLIVILDHHSIHCSAAIREFARPLRQRLKLFSLPTYSPQCNPDEGVWSEVKPHGVARQTIHDKQDFKAKLFRALRSLQKQTAKILSCFFRTPECESITNTILAMSG